MSAGAIFITCVIAMFPALILVAVVVKLWEVRAASRWPATTGRVVVSKVSSKRKKPGEPGYNFNDTEVATSPLVEYEYKVDGRTLRCQRITIGEKIAGAELEATLARYPVGAEVTVYYDPARPNTAVLERDLSPGMVPGLGCVLLFFIGGPLLAAFLYFNGVAWLQTHLDKPQRAPIVAALTGFGLLVCYFGVVFTRMVRQAQRWPTTPGRITAAGVDAYRVWSRRNRLRTHFKPAVQYSYQVNGREYSGDRVNIGVVVSGTMPGLARRLAAKYPVGSEVNVYYNPASPGDSVLNPHSRIYYGIWLVAAVVFALSWAIAAGRLG